MKRIFFALLLVLVATAPALATPTTTANATISNSTPTATVSTGTSSASITPTPDTPRVTPVPSPVPTDSPTPTTTPQVSGEAVDSNIRVDPTLTIKRYYYRNGQFVLILDNQMPQKSVTITENLGNRGDGIHSLNAKRVPLDVGTSRVAIDAPLVDGEATASISTRQSINNGRVIALQETRSADLLDGPYPSSSVAAASLAGLLMGGVLLPIGITVYRNRRKGGQIL
jgi:hypothetical protein